MWPDHAGVQRLAAFWAYIVHKEIKGQGESPLMMGVRRGSEARPQHPFAHQRRLSPRAGKRHWSIFRFLACCFGGRARGLFSIFPKRIGFLHGGPPALG